MEKVWNSDDVICLHENFEIEREVVLKLFTKEMCYQPSAC